MPRHLGPDLLVPEPGVDEAAVHLDRASEGPIGEVLLLELDLLFLARQLQARVDAVLASEAAALTEFAGLLPLAYPAICAAVAGRPEVPKAAGLRLLTGFDE
ncbi:MAG: hypothetical protein IPO88_10775 [Nannocystis sp.]|uniref:hypothetical protein n=1 Tax=Nannocystis sp. TaxID=1962667 RepID=UPI00242535DC|nr:hypothetical protein [Nannocystis sp.]MBK9753972.1 hypothetical protein [Nannocystis sp.]